MPATGDHSADGGSRPGRRVSRYAVSGLGMGVFLSVLPVLSFAMFGDKPFVDLHTTLPRVLALYIGGGCIAGALVGLVMPIIRSSFIAGFVGSIVGVIFGCAMHILDTSGKGWTSASVFAVVVTGVALGGSLGVFYRHDSQNE